MSKEAKYHKLTVEGDRKTQWICGCFETVDSFFWFCPKHKNTLSKAIEAQIDELDMTGVVE
ncbi:MAG: hypothetical protein FJ354_03730 [Thaumarchaeota archaeon]|nr:hypothetical protein [Nitrososphaerota archaeon]